MLAHHDRRCEDRYPVIRGIPRLLTGPERARVVARHASWFDANDHRRTLGARWAATPDAPSSVVESFDFEWSLFRQAGTAEQAALAELYFDLIPSKNFGPDQLVLDAGCGAGRWTRWVAQRGPRVIAVDLGLSVEVAARNAEGLRVAGVQADLAELPLADSCVDWAYSLGVLHHIADPLPALQHIVRSVPVGRPVLLYLYYALDGRGRMYRALFHIVNGIRRIVSRLPHLPALAVAGLIALLTYWPLARISRVLVNLRLDTLADALPLAFYRDLSFSVMLNDSLDRFGTRIERRYTRTEMESLMTQCGLEQVSFSSRRPYWHAVGHRV